MDALGRQLAFAFRFYTRIPLLGLKVRVQPGDIAKSTSIFPLVGFIEGIFVAIVTYCGSLIDFELGYIISLCCLLSRMVISRGQVKNAAHAFDGMGSVRDRVRMIKIMFDTEYGTMGIVTFVLDWILKYALYFALFNSLNIKNSIPIVICSCIAGKLCCVTGIAASGSVFQRDRLIDDGKAVNLVLAAALTGAVTWLILGWVTAIIMLILQISVGLIISGNITLTLGGLTKQTLGIMHEIGEISFLFIMLIW